MKDIKKVIRERGDVSKAVLHNITLFIKNSKLNLPNYTDEGIELTIKK